MSGPIGTKERADAAIVCSAVKTLTPSSAAECLVMSLGSLRARRGLDVAIAWSQVRHYEGSPDGCPLSRDEVPSRRQLDDVSRRMEIGR